MALRRTLTIGTILLGFAFSAIACPTAHAEDEIDAREVNDAIDAACEYLLAQQRPNGEWDEYLQQPGGLSALCTLALLNSGRKPSEPKLAAAIDRLISQKTETVYSSSLIIMALTAADPTGGKYSEAIRRHAAWLEKAQHKKNDDNRGGWGYGADGLETRPDNSNSQFALLGLYEAKRALPELKIAPQTWEFALKYWLTRQHDNGAWCYGPKDSGFASGSMTCAGVSSVIIASGMKHGSAASFDESGNVSCCGATSAEDNAVERGCRWLGNHFSVVGHPEESKDGGRHGFRKLHFLYYLYGMERVGRLTSRRFFMNRKGDAYDWYRMGAESIVRSRRDKVLGAFLGDEIPESNRLISTSFCLLFLAKGRRPVVMAKLQWGDPDSNEWDIHRGGVGSAVSHIERLWKRDLSWQTIAVSKASVEDLLESPILFLSGREALSLDVKDKEKLKRYLEQGGFLFAEACHGDGCDGKEFDASFRKLMKELFPESKLRLLPPDHPVWFAETPIDPKHAKPLLGVDMCCRTAVVYCPENLSCLWELKRPDRGGAVPSSLKPRLDAAMAIAANVAAYATNRELKEKLDRPKVSWDDAAARSTRRGAIVIPKLAHSGGADDATNALTNLGLTLEKEAEIRVERHRVILSPDDPKLYDYPIVFIHGRRAFRFTADERTALREFLERGGFLFGDAICGSQEFANSFRQEMEAILPTAKLQRLSKDHPILGQGYRGFDLSSVSLRDPAARSPDDPLSTRITRATPLLEGIAINERLAVVFSPFDISCALEKGNSPECKGYIHEDAAKIATNIVLYGLQE